MKPASAITFHHDVDASAARRIETATQAATRESVPRSRAATCSACVSAVVIHHEPGGHNP